MKKIRITLAAVFMLAAGFAVASSNNSARIAGFQKTVANQNCVSTLAVPNDCSDSGDIICTNTALTTVYYQDNQCLEFFLRES